LIVLRSFLRKPLSSLDRRVAATLKEGAPKQSGSGPRIAIVGECQSFGVAYAAQLLNLDATVHRFPVHLKSRTDLRTLASALRLYDHVFLQAFPDGVVRGGSSDYLRDQFPGAIFVPSLIFTAYHPDSIFIADQASGGATVAGPIGPYHSAIILFAYRAGLSADAALRLFEREVFEALGYFDVWDAASREFLKGAEAESLDLSADFLRWTRRGCFMHSINHPMLHVLYDITRHLFDKAGVPTSRIDVGRYVVDDLVFGPVYPVYPAIAEYYGIEGSYLFKGAYFDFENGVGNFWDLPRFVRDCYRVYAQYKPSQLANERVQGWLDDAEIASFLRGVAAGPGSAVRAH
jgi:hypothetical protein